jgi:excinuclease ABC subunit C
VPDIGGGILETEMGQELVQITSDIEPQLSGTAGIQPQAGVEVIKAALRTMPSCPGVYRMLGAKGDPLYVGKAVDLRRRVANYARSSGLEERIRLMVSLTHSMEIVTTRTEAEALLLEANLIKSLMPRFNIVLRDDKSYPWLMLTDDHPYPQIGRARGNHVKGRSYWGPFASAWAVSETVSLLQKVFLLRSCEDSVFAGRSRPCLLHQIKRCSAPCTGRIGAEDYASLVGHAKAFLSGDASAVKADMAAEMERASQMLDFERAAAVRDRIKALAYVRGRSGTVNPTTLGDADVVALWQDAGRTCVQVFFVRGGRNNGTRAFFPAHEAGSLPGVVLVAFLAQFYDDKPPPPSVLVNHDVDEAALLAEALSMKAGRKVVIHKPQRGQAREVVEHAETNAREALGRMLAESAGQVSQLRGVAELFRLPSPPLRIECYDNSHLGGTSAYGAMVVFGPEGPMKSAYRKWAIKDPQVAGDDFAMMREVLQRRFSKAVVERANGGEPDWPDLVVIDGGEGQLGAVAGVMDAMGADDVPLVAMAKGVDRNAGREWFHTLGHAPFQLEPRDPVLYYLQRVRDEAHRFVITTHRTGRSKAMVKSELDQVPGVGPARKRALLNHFGSVRAVRGAALPDLESVPGVNRETARRVFGHFHPGIVLEA